MRKEQSRSEGPRPGRIGPDSAGLASAHASERAALEPGPSSVARAGMRASVGVGGGAASAAMNPIVAPAPFAFQNNSSSASIMSGPMRVALLYDMDACHFPTGVTRHALSQLERLARNPEIRLSVLSGRITQRDGLAYWRKLGELPKRELPIRTRNLLRYWRLISAPKLEFFTGEADWSYSPAEFCVPTRKAKRAVTSHDILQDMRYGNKRRTAALEQTFRQADLILSVSNFNTKTLLEYFPFCQGKVALTPNGAEDLFFEPAAESERAEARRDLDLPEGLPYFVSVANFQARKNLPRLVRVFARLPEAARGDIGLVLLGVGDEDQARPIRDEIAKAGPRARIRMPGYREGIPLRAVYAESLGMVFPSLCEGFGIPVVEAMAQGVPAVLADSTALPEIGGAAGWYFEPENDESMLAAFRQMLDQSDERARRVALGRTLAQRYRWDVANSRLVQELRNRV